jgi:hypothetical protein
VQQSVVALSKPGCGTRFSTAACGRLHQSCMARVPPSSVLWSGARWGKPCGLFSEVLKETVGICLVTAYTHGQCGAYVPWGLHTGLPQVLD